MILSTILACVATGAGLGATIGGVLEAAGVATAKTVAEMTLAGAGLGLVAGAAEADAKSTPQRTYTYY